jgi:hypothetical protein
MLGVVGAFARGCHAAGIAQFCLLSAAGSTARSRFSYVRVMGMKEDTVRNVGFARLAIFRPGISCVEHIGLFATTEVEFRNGNGSVRIPLLCGIRVRRGETNKRSSRIPGSDAEHRKGRISDHGVGQVPHAAMSAGLMASSDHEDVGIRLQSGLKQRSFD